VGFSILGVSKRAGQKHPLEATLEVNSAA
jgi:hypothetical protein